MIEKSEKKKRKNNGKRRKFWIIHEKTESILILMQVMGSWADQRWIFTIHPNEEANGNKTAVRNDIHVLRGGGNMYTFEQCLPFSRRFYDDVYSRRSSRETGVKNNLVRRETLVITFLRFSQFPSWERWVDIYLFFFFFLLTRNCISFYLFFLFFFLEMASNVTKGQKWSVYIPGSWYFMQSYKCMHVQEYYFEISISKQISKNI